MKHPWPAALVRYPTDPTYIALVIGVVVTSVPVPLGDCALVLYVDYHNRAAWCDKWIRGIEGRKQQCLVMCTRLDGASCDSHLLSLTKYLASPDTWPISENQTTPLVINFLYSHNSR